MALPSCHGSSLSCHLRLTLSEWRPAGHVPSTGRRREGGGCTRSASALLAAGDCVHVCVSVNTKLELELTGQGGILRTVLSPQGQKSTASAAEQQLLSWASTWKLHFTWWQHGLFSVSSCAYLWHTSATVLTSPGLRVIKRVSVSACALSF